MVFVADPIQSSFASQSSYLRSYMAENFRWPSPDAGFALFVPHEISQSLPFKPPWAPSTRLNSSTQAPELAAAGFHAAVQSQTAETAPGWAEGFARLTERDAFPLDRLAFTFRPYELLGVVLGAMRTPTLSESQRTWLTNVVREAAKKSVTDKWSRYLTSCACEIVGVGNSFSVEPLPNHGVDELAMLTWLKSTSRFKGVQPWSNIDEREVQREFLRRLLGNGAMASDIGRASLLHASIQIGSNSLLQSSIDVNWQVRSATKDAMQLIVEICRRFPKTAQQLGVRHASRPTLTVTDEYDVQDLLHSLLWLHFDDVRPEEWAPSYGGVSSRMDFLLKPERVVVETKMTRKNLKQKEVVKQLIEDKEHYKSHPDCDALVAFVYDPAFHCHNAVALENDLSETANGFSMRVVVAPKAI